MIKKSILMSLTTLIVIGLVSQYFLAHYLS